MKIILGMAYIPTITNMHKLYYEDFNILSSLKKTNLPAHIKAEVEFDPLTDQSYNLINDSCAGVVEP